MATDRQEPRPDSRGDQCWVQCGGRRPVPYKPVYMLASVSTYPQTFSSFNTQRHVASHVTMDHNHISFARSALGVGYPAALSTFLPRARTVRTSYPSSRHRYCLGKHTSAPSYRVHFANGMDHSQRKLSRQAANMPQSALLLIYVVGNKLMYRHTVCSLSTSTSKRRMRQPRFAHAFPC